MTRPVLVLVTGSRALAGNDDARAWLRAQLDARQPAIVAMGDARGPDAVALAWCREQRDVNSMAFALDGKTYHARHHATFGWTATYQWSDLAIDERPDPRRWPLVRNEAMVHEIAEHADAADITVLGLRCASSKTHGTDQTLRLARKAGLAVVEESWA